MDTDGKRPRPASVPTPGCTPELIEGIRVGLRAAADPIRAPRMQAYMKSEMPYLGVPMPGGPQRRRRTTAVAIRPVRGGPGRVRGRALAGRDLP